MGEDEALVFAAERHAHQKDKNGEPYMLHVIRVWMKARRHTFDEKVGSVALLHDVVEDTACTLGDIEFRFGNRVRLAVDAISKRESESLDDYLERVMSDPIARRVKYYDAKDNFNRLHKIDDVETYNRLHDKYTKVIATLARTPDTGGGT